MSTGLKFKVNLDNMKREYTVNTKKIYPIRFFCKGDKYEFWGLFKMGPPPVLSDQDEHRCSCSGPTGWVGMCCRVSSTAPEYP